MPVKKNYLISNQKEGEELIPLEQNGPGMLGTAVKDLIFPFGLHSNTETLAVPALTFLQYIQKYLSVLKSLIPACFCGPQGSKTPGKRRIPELERDRTPDR